MKLANYAIRINGGTNEGPCAQIHLFNEDNKLAGYIQFYDTTEIPAGSNDNYLILTMPFHKFSAIVDVLRNESPVFIKWQEGGNNGFISTTQERIGEGEE